MPIIDDLSNEIKKQPDKHYRWVRRESGNISTKKSKGYEPVSPQDPEVKGTILEKSHKNVDSSITIGNLQLMRCTEEQHKKNRSKVQERNDRIQSALKAKYLEGGEGLKRSLGKKHEGIKLIHEESD